MDAPILRYMLILAALLALGLPLGCARAASADCEITVVLRYDDYSAKSPTDLDAQIIAAFRQRGLRLTVGVVPYISSGEMTDPAPQDLLPLSAEKGALLREAMGEGAIEVGLHGYAHQTNSAQRMSEFAGLDYGEQIERLRAGRALLEDLTGASVTLFIPPWNTYDQTTLRALGDLGFGTLSAEMRGDVAPDDALAYVPFTCYPRDLRDVLSAARASRDPRPVVVVLFHSYDFVEANPYRGIISVPELGGLLTWLQGQPDVRVLSVDQAVNALSDLDAHRTALNRTSLAWSDALIPPLQVQVADCTFLAATPVLRSAGQLRVGLTSLALLAISALAGLALGRYVAPGQPRWRVLVLSLSTLAAVAALGYMLRDLHIQWRGALVATLLVGGCVGLWLAPRSEKADRARK
jgi:peptidoglycan/xylan/chitin deacetylase (PgdA/CDA1 family)